MISYIKIEYTQRVWIMYIIVFSLNFLTVKELSNQHIHFKGILSSKFVSKDMLVCSSFVSTEDENVLIDSRLIWFDDESCHEHPQK